MQVEIWSVGKQDSIICSTSCYLQRGKARYLFPLSELDLAKAFYKDLFLWTEKITGSRSTRYKLDHGRSGGASGLFCYYYHSQILESLNSDRVTQCLATLEFSEEGFLPTSWAFNASKPCSGQELASFKLPPTYCLHYRGAQYENYVDYYNEAYFNRNRNTHQNITFTRTLTDDETSLSSSSTSAPSVADPVEETASETGTTQATATPGETVSDPSIAKTASSSESSNVQIAGATASSDNPLFADSSGSSRPSYLATLTIASTVTMIQTVSIC
ncbi:uncharacterized protein B0I36DRAFT_354951 [Microdochium trichocladiopsis]|uniref:Uncharacterized protein n=1 Tax=Microdochium trichocladiopsis TaxID=1682393 RepID=A0A9P8XSS2_9PEZI|nr:uncharacterized protein B0I36DRAFT_354951 [Microdochium trichocladiopsis]KAH7016082.1 hypothetical protein B0I36DRAFT_354951 [Microdochium trichocladiopsis]